MPACELGTSQVLGSNRLLLEQHHPVWLVDWSLQRMAVPSITLVA